MRFNFRKSFRIGDIKITLSKSGISYSVCSSVAGIRCVKITEKTEKNTKYILGTGVAYFELPENKRKKKKPEKVEVYDPTLIYKANTDLRKEEQDLRDQFLIGINMCKTFTTILNMLLVITCVSIFMNFSFILFLIVLLVFRARFMKFFKTKVDYSFDDFYEKFYNELSEWFEVVRENDKIWLVESEHMEDDKRHNFGSKTKIERKEIHIMRKVPVYLDMNIVPYCFEVDKKMFYLLPDRILIDDSYTVSDIGFSELELEFGKRRYTEEKPLPQDAKVVDMVWHYQNNDGTPDRRFNDNSQIPVCEYFTVHCRTDMGLNILFYLSNVNIGMEIQKRYDILNLKRLNFSTRC